MSTLDTNQLAIHMLVVAPAVYSAVRVGNCEISPTVPVTYVFDEVRIEAVAILHLAEHHILYLDLAMVFYWLVSATVATPYSWIQRIA